MNFLKTFLKLILIMGTVMTISACSKTVQWEEEVPLNTGETIWVKRTVEYTLQGGSGNPFDMAYRPGQITTKFDWKGKSYVFDKHGGVFVLAISPTGVPALVALADAGSWNYKNGYKCTLPFYVQFIPDISGKKWNWPEHIEPWLIGLSANLYGDLKPPNEMLNSYSIADKRAQPYLADPQLYFMHRIDASYTGDICKFQLGK
jgi:hypothetical protein